MRPCHRNRIAPRSASAIVGAYAVAAILVTTGRTPVLA